MAIQVVQQPGAISFAGDPIIVKAKTTLTSKTFLRIKLQCDVTAYRNSEEHPYSENYSFEVASDGVATFNVGSTVKTALSRVIVQDADSGEVEQTMYAAKFQLTYTEVFIDGMVEIEEGQVVSEEYQAIPGSLTEFERLTAANSDTTTILGDGRILSRKPDGELIPKGVDFYLPAVDTKTDTLAYSVQQGATKNDYSQFTGGALVPKSVKVTTDSLSVGSVIIGTAAEAGRKAYIVNPNPDMRSFIFLNGFGMLESITAVTKESLDYQIESELYAVPQEIGFRGNTQVVNYANSPEATFSMSSGFVNREWAEWWVNEFIVTRKAWMLHEGRYIPVAIIPEDSNKLFDRSKPGLIAVNFSVRYSFTGGTHNSFVR